MSRDLADAALRLAASGLRLHVFACAADKRPITTNGHDDATRDPGAIREMFGRRGAARIGVATEASGLVVVDVDIKDGRDGRPWAFDNMHRLPETRMHRTPSGGMHWIFSAPPESTVKGSVGRKLANGKLLGIALGVDVKARGGYVIWPSGLDTYMVARDAPPASLPQWLAEACGPPPPPPMPFMPIRMDGTGTGTRYGTAALRRACERIRTAGFGSQEATINSEVFSIGRLAAGGAIGEAEALHALLNAGLGMPSQAGREPWTAPTVEKKIRTAFAAGTRRPREAPPPMQHSNGGGRAHAR